MTRTTPPVRPARPACTNLGLVGDSTGIFLADEADSVFTPGTSGFPLDSLTSARVKTVNYDILGGRSFVEGTAGTNGIRAMERISARSTPDCWLMVMGTNDAANIAVGSTVGAAERIKRVLDAAGDAPVFWASPVIASTATVNGYRSGIADDFTAALKGYSRNHPRLRVIDMKAAYRIHAGKNGLPGTVDGFFTPDGIHYPTGKVTQLRADIMADALR